MITSIRSSLIPTLCTGTTGLWWASLRIRCSPTGLNLRVSPNEIFQLLALTMMLAPTFDDAQEFGMFCQKQDQIVGLATLYGTTVVVEGTKHHFDRDPLQGF